MAHTSGTFITGIFAVGALVALAACQAAPNAAPEPLEPVAAEPVDTGPMAECPVRESANWLAYIDRMPGPDAVPTLRIRGQVVMPTPGYSFAWREGIADRAMPPGVRYILEVSAPTEPVIQVLTPEEVAYDGPALSYGYRVIYVLCGDQVLAEITDIGDVY